MNDEINYVESSAARRNRHRESLEHLWQKELVFLKQLFDKNIPLAPMDLIKFHDYVYLHCSSFVHNPSVRSQDPGKDLYGGLTLYLNSRLQEISKGMENIADDKDLVVEYVGHWKKYWKACEELDRGCRYLNQNWVKRERFEGHDYIHEIYRMAMIRWKEVVFSPIDRALVTAITLILRHKATEQSKLLVYQVLQSIVELYANDERQEVSVPSKLNNVFTEEVVGFYKSETLAEFQRIILSNTYTHFKHFLKYWCLAMPEINDGVQFRGFVKRHLALQLKNAIAKSLGGKEYVEAILKFRRSPLARAMRDHKNLVAVIDEVCSDTLNKMDQKVEPIRLLVIYSNELMTNKSVGDILEELKQIVEVVEFINEKDKFIQKYWRALRARQIKEISVWDGNESTMISLLTKKFGVDLTYTLKNQLDDLEKSRTKVGQFQNYMDSMGVRLCFDFRLKYFKNRGLDANFNLILPEELRIAVEQFKMFHTEYEKSKRKVVFHHGLSSGEIICNLGQSTKILEVSTLQMSILLLFNEKESFTEEELKDRLGTPMDILQPALEFWKSTSFLICSGTSVAVNTNFTSKKRRLNFNKVANGTKTRRIDEKEDSVLQLKRKKQTDAAIVRIMKKHKELEHPQLISNVVEELRYLFIPNVAFIKERIADLINKEYVMRCGRSTYRYIQ
ncbi:cullin homolog 1 [Drosophila biarmipes]|uniref:cullin homolog 1 n=1 Tax=Drosophila biarmipes TaxID=125945 RepID=UPI0007E7A7C0|nr:cullin homolog 1 [Drosophila biarmipes]